MNILINKAAETAGTPVALEDLILTADLPTTGGSMMLDGYMSLFDAEIVGKLKGAGFGIVGKANVGEFGFDLWARRRISAHAKTRRAILPPRPRCFWQRAR